MITRAETLLRNYSMWCWWPLFWCLLYSCCLYTQSYQWLRVCACFMELLIDTEEAGCIIKSEARKIDTDSQIFIFLFLLHSLSTCVSVWGQLSHLSASFTSSNLGRRKYFYSFSYIITELCILDKSYTTPQS